MRSLRRLPLCALVILFVSSPFLLAQHATPSVRIVTPIDNSQLVTIKGSVHPFANAQNDRGPASPGMQLERLHLILKRSPAQDTALRQLIQEQNTPGSPSYHKWLTPAQFAAQFGPSQQDVTTVETWLSDQGFTVNKLDPGNQTLDISGTVGQLQSAFHTQIHRYMVNGQLHYANASNPAIPAALAPVVGGFVSLNNFHYHSYAEKLGEAAYDPSTGRAKPSWTITGTNTLNFVLSPADFAIQYDLPSTIKGDGQTIAIVNDSNINIGLVNQFRSLFGLPANPPQVIVDGNDPGVDGINNPEGPNGDSVEAYLDVEWAGAVAPNATVDLVIAADTSLETGLALAAEHAVYSNVAPVVSVSFGGCELFQGSSNAFWNSLWEQAAAQGQTVIVSTGDSGSAGCDEGAEYASYGLGVNGLASTPYDVAVGGTDFFYSSWNSGNSTTINDELATYWNATTSNSTPKASIIKAPIPEQPWNSSQYGLDLFNLFTSDGSTTIAAGGGGASSAALCSGTYGGTFTLANGFCSVKPTGYPKPAWQTGTGVPGDGVRDIPDVSLFASNGYNFSYYPICATDGDCQPVSAGGTVQIFGVGGTSASAPAFAGIMALVNQKYGRQGQADTILYPLKVRHPEAFHDVTNGNISVPCAFSATANLNSPNCIQIASTNYDTITDSGGNIVLEGQIGTGMTAEYNAGTGYNLATGLGSVDAATLINYWGSVTLAASAVSFNATPTSITHGQSLGVSGAVTGSGTPTGNVAIMTDSTETSQQGQTTFALDGSGNYSGSLSMLPGGSYNIWASYGGDTKNGAQVSSKIPITVTPEDSGIAFGLFANGTQQHVISNLSASVDYGTQLMLSARVAPKADASTLQTCTTSCPTFTAPTGTVAFKDNSSTLNTAIINTDGDAEYNAPFSVGSHSVSASYNGDSSYNASTSSAITFTVAKDMPTLTASASAIDPNSHDAVNGPNQPLVITVQVLNTAQASAASFYPVPVAAPTGTVTATGLPSGVPTTATLTAATDPYSVGGVYTGGTQAVEGVANFIVPAGTTSNTYNVKFSYGGDSNYAASSISATIPIENTTGDGAQTPTITASLSGSISPNSTLIVSGAVTGTSGHPAPTGNALDGTGILVYASGYYISEIDLAPGTGLSSSFQYTFDSSNLPQGANQITLQYTGDSVYNPVAITLNSGNTIDNPLSDFTLSPENTVVPVTLGGSATDTIHLASVNNFTGAVTLTCTAPTGVTCGVSTSPVNLAAGGSTTSALNIAVSGSAAAQNYNVLVTANDSTGEYVHTLGITIAAGSPNLYLTNTGTIHIPATGGSGTSVFTATPINGFTGTVNLSCAVTGVPSGAASPITCGASNLSTASLNIGATPQTSTLTIDATSSTTVGTYQVTVTGTSGSVTASSVVNVAVAVVPPDFAISSSGNITIKAGATSGNTSTITIQSKNSFDSAVSLACAISPTAASDPATCSFNSSSITPVANGTATATLTIATTAATSAMMDHKTIFWPSAGGGLVLACAVFFWIPKKRRSWLAMFVLLVFLGSMAGMACGGGGGGGGNSGGNGGGGGGNPGTTAGTYTVTVTATSGSLSHSASVNLTVQ